MCIEHEEKVENQNYIGTSCRFCEFNVKDENNNQIGCEVNILNRYKEKGVGTSIVEFDDEHGKASASQLDTFCLFRRPPGWKKAKQNEDKSFLDIARNELILETTVIVFIPPGKTFDDVVKFVEKINNMSVKPKRLLFMNCAKISPILFKTLDQLTTIQWGMEFIVLKLDDPINELRNRSNDLGVKKSKTGYILTVDIDNKLPSNYIEKLTSIVVDDLGSFIAVLDDEVGKPNFYQAVVYRYLRGNDQAGINEKIRWKAEDQECQHLVKMNKDVFQPQK